MLVSEVINLAGLQAEEVYDDPTWIKYINMALDDLTPVAKVLKKKENINTTLTEGKGTIDLISDPDLSQSHEILYVYANGEQLARLPINDNISKGYKITAGQILLQGLTGVSATCRVDYYARLGHVSSLSDDLETTAGLPAEYHNLVVLYCCAKSQQKEEELNDKSDFYNEYMLGKRQMALDRIWEMEPHNRKFIRKTRIAALIGATTE
ncbi:MAG TPA: hypothetical protein GXX19_08940 [Syntrophomonadaceae bacterium]|nr:hypothetical protein [Syntrophomonadaceae bacterium]